MRFALRIMGVEFIAVELGNYAEAPEEEYEPGDCISFPVGFVAQFDKPDEVGLPDRWND